MINKLLSIFMAVTMLSSSFSPIDKNSFNSIIGYFSNIFQNFENEEDYDISQELDDFSNDLSDLLSKYNEDNYFSKIVIDTKSNTIQKDGESAESLEKYNFDYSAVNSLNPIVSAEALFDILQIENEIDYVSGKISAFLDGAKQNIEAHFSSGATLSDKKQAFLYAEQLEDEFFLESEIENDKIILRNPYQTKRLIVQTKNEKKLSKNYGCVEKITDGNGCYILQFKTEKETKDAFEKLSGEKFVEYVVSDKVVSTTALSEREGATLIQSDRYKKYLKKNNKTTKITVAVVDTGVDTTHPFLKNRIVSGYDAIRKKSTVKDRNGHGSHVAGIVVDNTPSNVKIMPIKVLGDDGSGTDLTVKLGVEYAIKKKVDVINMSLGGECAGKGCQQCATVKKAIKAGITVVVAAGNDTSDTKNFCPAKIDDCITVASCSADNVNISNYSNFGSSVDVTAPGENILSCAPGGDYVKLSGTSMATPFAAAAVAMILVNQPSLSVSKTQAKLKSYCADMNITGWDKYSGEGVINFGIALGDNIPARTIYIPDEEISMSYFNKCAKETAEIYIDGKEGKNEILTNRSFTVKSSNTKVASFDGKFINPKSDGKAKITITIGNGKSASFDVVLKKKEVWIDYASSKYEKGNGTKDNPYIISNAKQLAKFALDMRNGKSFNGKYLKLSKDIDLKGKYWITAGRAEYDNGWITQGDTGFKGVFDGANHKIKNMTVFDEDPATNWYNNNVPNIVWYLNNTGFLMNIKGGTVKRLGLENAYCENIYGAILASFVDGNSTIKNCYTTGFCRGSGMFGSVTNYNIEISNCFSSATVCKAGIAESIYSSNDSRGPVIVSNTFFCGKQLDASSDEKTGSFSNYILGCEETSQTYIYNCFSASEVINGVGFTDSIKYSNLYNCYYNEVNSDGYNEKISSSIDIREASASFFKKKSSFTKSSNWNNLFKWDFDNTWAISSKVNNGFPYLKRMKPSETVSRTTGTWIDYASKSYGGGDGSKKSPYLINTPSQLAKISYIYQYGGGENVYFKLNKDIDLSAHYWYPVSAGLNLGNSNGRCYFSGHIDGNGKTITGLKIKNGKDYCGLISSLIQGSVKNLKIKNADISAQRCVGIICGSSNGYSSIYNCSVSGNVSGTEMVGGVVGENQPTSSVVAVNSTATVRSTFDDSNSAGGIVGMNEGEIISSTYKTTAEVPTSFAGIANWCISGKIENCFSFGALISPSASLPARIVSSYSIFNNEGMIYSDSYENDVPTYITYDNLKNQNSYIGFDFSKDWSCSQDVNYGFPVPKKPAPSNSKKTLPTKLWRDVKASSFGGGKGTKASPYLIKTAKQLAYMVYALDYENTYNGKYFRLANDIDLKGRLWSNSFQGALTVTSFYFDGNGKTISNLTSDNGDGLFPFYFEKGEIANLKLENVYGASFGIVSSNNGKIKNCAVTGNLKASIDKTEAIVNISQVGGICKDNGGTIERCSVNITASGDSNVAGICSYDTGSSKVLNCFVNATLKGSQSADPFLANNSSYNIKNCLGIVNTKGYYDYNSSCYILGDTSKPEQNLKNKSTFKNWNFSSVWAISKNKNSGYPYLRDVTQRKITYNLKGGELPSYVQKTYIPGYQYTLPTPTRKNYYFDGWYKDSSYKTKITVIGKTDSGNIKLYAKWKKAYNIAFYSNYGSNKKVIQQIPVSEKTPLIALPFERTGYDFLGWAKSKNGKVAFKNKEKVYKLASAGKTIKLYAVWSPRKYEVIFESNGGSGEMGIMNCQKFVYGKSQKLLKCAFKAPKGKVFAGWSIGYKGVIPTYKDGQTVKNLSDGTEAVTLYAFWVKPESHKISYNLNGGKMPSSYSKSYKSGTGYKLPTPTRKGYKFIGWYSDSNFNSEKTTEVKPWETTDKLFYARWKKA